MNYRHAYHAGNFADCFKHVLLVALLEALARKPGPFFVLDTHAGSGWYDLDSPEARCTAEADQGIRRLLTSTSPALSKFLELVKRLGLYPGSPAIISGMIRSNDKLACCELHPDDFARLRRHFRGDTRVALHERCGWEALGALLPPVEKRGLVFVDPPFEARDEFQMLVEGLRRGHRRFGNGVFAAWYPIKDMSAVRNFRVSLASCGIRDIVDIELNLRNISIPGRLNGCGLAVINPPYQFEEYAAVLANAVLEGVGDHEQGSCVTVTRLVNE